MSEGPKVERPWAGRRRWWALALGSALVATPILAVNAPQDVRLPQLKARSKPPPALFSHWQHNELQCFACHPSTFPQGLVGFTHKEMQAGGYCGSCHDGRSVTAIKAMRCGDCHAP